jgi:uncharacterized membrane protein
VARIERSIVINTPWEKVDAIALDGSRNGEWYSGVQSSEADATYPNVGGICTMHYKAGPTSFDIRMEVLEYVPGDYILYHIDGGVLHGTSRWSHRDEGNGTQVTCVLEYDATGGGLGAIADKLVLERMNTHQLEESLENLKQAVEAS